MLSSLGKPLLKLSILGHWEVRNGGRLGKVRIWHSNVGMVQVYPQHIVLVLYLHVKAKA